MKEKLKNLISFKNIISIISIILTTILILSINKLGMLPNKYFIILSIVSYLFNILFIVLIKLNKRILNIFGYIFITIMMLGSIFGIVYLRSTNNFLDKSFNNASNKKKLTYYVVVNKDSNITKISMINNKILSYYRDDNNISKAIDELKTNVSFETSPSDSLNTIFDDSNNIILVSKSHYDLVTSIDDKHPRDNYKIIYKFNLYEKISLSSNEEKDSFNIFIGGRDFTNTNMDLNMLVTINTKTHKVLFTAIPRDYYMMVHGYDKRDTLSYMGALGIDTNIKSIEDLFGIKIDYYISVKTSSLVGLVDAVGGINYCSDDEYTTTHAMILDSYDDRKGKKLYVKKGCQHLNGIQTLTVARERISHKGGDRKRQANCQAIVVDIFEKLVSTNTLTNYNSILDSLSDLYETNISKEVISSIIKDTLNNGNNWSFENQSVNGVDTKDYVHMTDLKDYVTYPDMITVESAVKRINEVLNK